MECRIARNDGAEVWVSFSLEEVRDAHGAPVRIVGALQDITKRRRAEIAMEAALREAEAANLAKSAFLATISHEIRTPLNGVLGMAQAMTLGPLAGEQRQRLEIIRQSGESLLVLLNDVLDLSKIEAGHLDLESVEFELEPLLASAIAAFQAVAAEKGVALTLDTGGAQGRLRGDPTRLRQILYNLVSNALKFTAQGEVKVSAEYADPQLKLVVSDTGVGMSEDVLGTIFRPFIQADASTTRQYGGTGLGLAICQRLAAMMGGDIRVSSTVGKGSTFTFSAPLMWCGEAQATTAPAANTGAPISTPAGLRVLAAEDNPTNQLVLRTLLEQVGIEPIIVENGQAALDAWMVEPFDLILMDVQMPAMDGPTATRAIRAQEAATGRPRTPIIALTANAMSHQTAEYFGAGMDATVTKPIELERFFHTVAAVLNANAEPQPDSLGGPVPASAHGVTWLRNKR